MSMHRLVQSDYDRLHTLFDLPGYAGYRADVREIPNGDGQVDHEKRYVHVMPKYDPPGWAMDYFEDAYRAAIQICVMADIPEAFWPAHDMCALRVLEYPAGAGGHAHTDFDLLTLNLFRNGGECLPRMPVHFGELAEIIGWGPATRHTVVKAEHVQQSIVFFALPHSLARLPDGRFVGEWLAGVYPKRRMVVK